MLASITSIGGSDSCGGCDTTPGWASVGMVVFGAALVLWLVYAAVLIARTFAKSS